MFRTACLILFLSTVMQTASGGDEGDKDAAEDKQAQRAGTCEEAKTQMKYWCEERQQVSVVVTGLECENAKRNVKEACEGIKSEDHDYK